MTPKFIRALLFVSTLLAATAALAAPGHGSNPVGEAGNAGQAARTVEVNMTDNMRFTPAQISVQQGETVRFVVKNSGVVKHELVIGSLKDLKEHAAMMIRMPGIVPLMVMPCAGLPVTLSVVSATVKS